MSYAAKWSSNTITKQIAVHHMTKYGHLLKWSEYQEICLEVGCGEGTITKEIFYPWIKDRIQKLVAIDKLDGMIQFAKEHNSAEKLEYHTLDIMDNNMTKGMKNQYDHVFSICVDHLITDTRSYASILHSLLKPGGQTFIITIADNFFKHSLDIMYRREKWSKYKPQQPIFTEYTANPVDYLSNILRNTGFNINECEHEKMSFVTEDFKDFIKALIEMYQNLGFISAELSDDFTEDLTVTCGEQRTFAGEPDKYEIHYNLVTWIATKSVVNITKK